MSYYYSTLVREYEEQKQAPLISAVKEGDTDKLEQILRDGQDVNELLQEYHYAHTALYVAVNSGNEQMVQFLLAKGADPNIYVHDSPSPLDVAAQDGKIKIIDMLLDAGAKIDSASKHSTTPLGWAILCNEYLSTIHLLKRGANVNHVDADELTPLIHAIQNGNIGLAEYIVVHYPETTLYKTSTNLTPLTFAIIGRKIRIITMLLEHGVTPNDGQSMHRALIDFDPKKPKTQEILRLLALYGGKVDLLDEKTKTTMHWLTVQNRLQAPHTLVDFQIKMQKWIFDPVVYASFPLEARIRIGVIAQLWAIRENLPGTQFAAIPIEVLFVILRQLLEEYRIYV